MADLKTNPESPKTSPLIETLYAALNGANSGGFDRVAKEALDSNPELAKLMYARVNHIASDHVVETAQIDTQKLADSLSTQDRATFLLNHFLLDFIFAMRSPGSFVYKGLDDVKTEYKALYERNSGAFRPKEFDGYPHLLAPYNLFNPLTVLLHPKESPFYFPKGTRLVVDSRTAEFAVDALNGSAYGEKKTVTVLYPSDLDTAEKPSADECQILVAPSQGDLAQKIDWSTMDLLAKSWEDRTVPMVGLNPELIAAIYVCKGQTPEEACKTAGLDKPEAKFLDQLKTKPTSNEAAPEEAEDLDLPDDTLDSQPNS